MRHLDLAYKASVMRAAARGGCYQVPQSLQYDELHDGKAKVLRPIGYLLFGTTADVDNEADYERRNISSLSRRHMGAPKDW